MCKNERERERSRSRSRREEARENENLVEFLPMSQFITFQTVNASSDSCSRRSRKGGETVLIAGFFTFTKIECILRSFLNV